MSLDTQKFVRKPLFVDAVQVTSENFKEIAAWVKGTIVENDPEPDAAIVKGPLQCHIKVQVHAPKNPRQTRAIVGDWILYTPRGFKVYTNTAFTNVFDLVQEDLPVEVAATIRLRESLAADGTGETPVLSEESRVEGLPENQPHHDDLSFEEATPKKIAEVVAQQREFPADQGWK